jgi:predicted Zn-dependent protease
MNPASPACRRRLTLLLLALFLLAQALPVSAQQKRRTRRTQRETTSAPAGSTLTTVAVIGSDVAASAARLLQTDPYAEFRGARYSNAGLITERDEVRLGQRLHQEVGKRYSLLTEGAERVNRIGQRVARTSLRSGIAYRFYVIDEAEINAFSGPGGYVYVTAALVRLANDDELASVLSHEVGHVVARHSLKSLQQREAVGGLADLFGSLTGVAGETAEELGKTAAQVVGSGLLAVHSREEEHEADFLGVRALHAAGFNTEGMITMFQKILNISRTNSSLLGSIFNDHPDVQERIDNTRYEIARLQRRPATRKR